MKLMLDMIERLRPMFESGGKFERMKPLFEATEHFFFAPMEATALAPHVRDPLDLKRFMSMVIVALTPCVIVGLHNFGLRVLAMIVVSYAVGGAVEVIFAIVRKEPINEGFLVTGLLFPLILPPGLPLWAVAAGIAFGVLVGKEVFGGTGYNLFNPALVGRCFLLLGYPATMAQSYFAPGGGWVGHAAKWVTAESAKLDGVTGATPLGLLKQAVKQTGEAGDTAMAGLPSLGKLFIGNIQGCVGETSALAIIVGGLFLLAIGVASWRAVAGCIGSFVFFGLVLNLYDPHLFGPVGFHLLAGGFLFGAFFMATDPVTGPTTACGRWGYGMLIGLVALLIRNLTGYMEGMMFAILLGNIAAPILDEIVLKYKLKRLRRLADER